MHRRRFFNVSAMGGLGLAATMASTTDAASGSGFDNGTAIVSWDVYAEPRRLQPVQSVIASKVLGAMVLMRVRDPREDGSGQFYVTIFGQFRRGNGPWEDCGCHPYYRDNGVYAYNGYLRDIQLVDQSSQTVSLFLPNNAWNLREVAQVRLAVRFFDTNNRHLQEFDAFLPMGSQPHMIKPDPNHPAETGENYSLSLVLPAGRPPVEAFDIRRERILNFQ